jgi:hypothetical protein
VFSTHGSHELWICAKGLVKVPDYHDGIIFSNQSSDSLIQIVDALLTGNGERGTGYVTPASRSKRYCWEKNVEGPALRRFVSTTLYILNIVKLSPAEPVRVADTQRPRSSQLVWATCWAQGPRMASVTPPGVHALGATMQVVAVITLA